MRAIDADALLHKRCQAMKYGGEMYVIGQGYVMDAPTITLADQWVSVEDRLPNVNRTKGAYEEIGVLTFNGKTVKPLIYERALIRGKVVYRWKYMFDRIYDGVIIHWMPYPQPPKDKSEGENDER